MSPGNSKTLPPFLLSAHKWVSIIRAFLAGSRLREWPTNLHKESRLTNRRQSNFPKSRWPSQNTWKRENSFPSNHGQNRVVYDHYLKAMMKDIYIREDGKKWPRVKVRSNILSLRPEIKHQRHNLTSIQKEVSIQLEKVNKNNWENTIKKTSHIENDLFSKILFSRIPTRRTMSTNVYLRHSSLTIHLGYDHLPWSRIINPLIKVKWRSITMQSLFQWITQYKIGMSLRTKW